VGVRSIWILNDNGIPLYARMTKGVKEDPVLVSGFICAISAFAKSIIGDEIKSIKLKKHTFYVKRCGEIIVAVLSDVNEEEEMEKLLSKIAEELSGMFRCGKTSFIVNGSSSRKIKKKIWKIINNTK